MRTIFEQLLQNPEQITFGALFIGLLVYVMKTNDTREKQYRNTIDRLTTALGTLEDVEQKLDNLSNTLTRHENKVG